jgi:hypothetical protein
VSQIIDTVVELGEPLAAKVAGIVFAVPGIRALIGQKDHDFPRPYDNEIP